MSDLFDPAQLPAPDELGYFAHPDLDLMNADDNEEFFDLSKFAKAGFACSVTEFEYDAPDGLNSRYYEDGEPGVIGWEPSEPKGEGWQSVGIWDTDSGPIAYFVRPVAVGAEA